MPEITRDESMDDLLEKIAELAGATGTHVTVPVQGSGTFAVEAMITSFVPKAGKLVMFPSWLMHQVRPYKGSAVRISIAMNLAQ